MCDVKLFSIEKPYSNRKSKTLLPTLDLQKNSFRFQKKNYYLIQEYFTVELEPPVKKKKQTQQSSIRIDKVLLSPVQAVEDINLLNEDCVSVSSVYSVSS